MASTNETQKTTDKYQAPASPQRGGFGRRSWGPKDEFDSKLLDLARVTRVAAGGKHMSFRASVVVGNRAAKVGFGVAKGLDVSQAVEKATRMAKKHLVAVPIVNDTIPHEIKSKYGAAEILLRPQQKGKGLVAGGTVRVICDLAGIKNISSKILGRTGNKISNARATLQALQNLKTRQVPAKKEEKKSEDKEKA